LAMWHCILSAEVTRNALLQTVFLAIFPTGLKVTYSEIVLYIH